MIEMQLDQIDSSQPLLGRHWCPFIYYSFRPNIEIVNEQTLAGMMRKHIWPHRGLWHGLAGFRYMSGAEVPAAPANPRTAVPVCLVGIAIGQCVIYSSPRRVVGT